MKREDRKRVRDAKVLPFEAVTKQHRLPVTDIEIGKQTNKRKPKKRVKSKNNER